MSLDHRDDEAVFRFSEEVDSHLGREGVRLEPWTLRLIGAWVIGGLLITLAVRSDGALSTVLYLVAFAIIAVWVAGFYVARSHGAHWYRS